MAPHLQDNDCYDQLEMEQHSVLSSTPSDNDTLDDMIDGIAMDNVDREEHMYINLGLKEDCCSIQFTASSSKDILKSNKSVMTEDSTHTTHRPASILRQNSAPSKLQSFTPSSSWSSTKTPPKTNTMRRTSSVVRFPPSYSMVTAQYTRPRTNLVELSKLYYSTEDIKRFKQEYRVERIILARQRQAAQQQQAQLVSQDEQSEKDDKVARGEDTTIQIVEENGEVSSLSSSQSTPPTSSQPSTSTSSTSHGNAYWRSKVSRRWGYGRRNSSSSVRTVSPERKDVPQEDPTSSSSLPSSDLSQLEPLSSSLTKLLDKPERKSLSYLLDASPAYDSDDESDDDSDSSPTPAPPPKESSSREVGSPKSMFSSAFDHFHHGSTSTMSSRQQCLVDTLYLF